MAKQTINVGSATDDGTGDPARVAFTKCNANFTELYTADTTFLTTTAAAATYQPLDADLTAIAALTGTNTIYYRSASNVWSPVVISTGLTFSGGILAATGGGTTVTTFNCGRLEYVSATALSFKPFNGNSIKISGTLFTIPSAGITGLANTSVFVNGTGGTNLAANTTYWVFAFSNSGTVTADFCTAATHATSTTAGNEGTEIRTADDSRSLIGLIRTNASSQFVDTAAQRFVRSWFNARRQSLISTALANESTTSTTWVEIATSKRVEFVKWVGEIVDLVFSGTQINLNIANVYSAIGIDSTIVSSESGFTASAASYRGVISSRYSDDALSEGYHIGQMYGAVGSNTGIWPSPTVASSVGSRLAGHIGGP